MGVILLGILVVDTLLAFPLHSLPPSLPRYLGRRAVPLEGIGFLNLLPEGCGEEGGESTIC